MPGDSRVSRGLYYKPLFVPLGFFGNRLPEGEEVPKKAPEIASPKGRKFRGGLLPPAAEKEGRRIRSRIESGCILRPIAPGFRVPKCTSCTMKRTQLPPLFCAKCQKITLSANYHQIITKFSQIPIIIINKLSNTGAVRISVYPVGRYGRMQKIATGTKLLPRCEIAPNLIGGATKWLKRKLKQDILRVSYTRIIKSKWSSCSI